MPAAAVIECGSSGAKRLASIRSRSERLDRAVLPFTMDPGIPALKRCTVAGVTHPMLLVTLTGRFRFWEETMRANRIFLVGVIALLGVGFGSATVHAAPKPAPASYYLALGDSLSAGYQTQAVNTDRSCKDAVNDATGHEGYVCLMYMHLLKLYPRMGVVNYGLAASPGEDTCSFRSVTNCLGATARRDNGPGDTAPYNVAKVAQLKAALKFIKSHPGKVKVITLNLGGNDMFPLLKLALSGNLQGAVSALPAVETRLATNYEYIASKLRQADVTAHIVFINQYDPLSGVPAAAFGPHGDLLLGFATQALKQMNAEVKHAASTNHARYADVYTPFVGKSPMLTHITETGPEAPNIHCTDMGYSAYAQVVGGSFKVPGSK